MPEFELHEAAELAPTDTDSRLLAAHAALWSGDIAGAAAELSALDASGFRIPAVEARRVVIRAGLAASEGNRAAALQLYRDALNRWRDLQWVFDEALTGIDMATLLDPADAEVRAAAATSREIFVRLRAFPFVRRLDAAMERHGVSQPSAVDVTDASAARSRALP